MLTLAFSQVVYTVAYYWRDVTGGDDGMLGIPKPEIGIPGVFSISLESFTNFYYFVLIIVAALIFLAWKIANSPFGKVLQAIREKPRARGIHRPARTQVQIVRIHHRRDPRWFRWWSVLDFSGLYFTRFALLDPIGRDCFDDDPGRYVFFPGSPPSARGCSCSSGTRF